MLGLVSVPLALTAAVGVLVLSGSTEALGTQPCMAMWSVRTMTRMRTSPSRRMG